MLKDQRRQELKVFWLCHCERVCVYVSGGKIHYISFGLELVLNSFGNTLALAISKMQLFCKKATQAQCGQRIKCNLVKMCTKLPTKICLLRWDLLLPFCYASRASISFRFFLYVFGFVKCLIQRAVTGNSSNNAVNAMVWYALATLVHSSHFTNHLNGFECFQLHNLILQHLLSSIPLS